VSPPDDSDEDATLVARARADRYDPRPFDALVRRHQGFVLANCRALSRSPADAEDLAQEVFVKAYFALPRFEQRAPFRAWLRTIKVNHCLNFLRRRKTEGWVALEDEDARPDSPLATPPAAEGALEQDDTRARIVRVLDQMSDTLRVPLMLCDADGLSYEEIAAQLGIGLSAVKMRIKRGREEFRRRYRALADAEGAPVPGDEATA
jgi:RNA polymerase sigma-70 factor (ECF subfamily)